MSNRTRNILRGIAAMLSAVVFMQVGCWYGIGLGQRSVTRDTEELTQSYQEFGYKVAGSLEQMGMNLCANGDITWSNDHPPCLDKSHAYADDIEYMELPAPKGWEWFQTNAKDEYGWEVFLPMPIMDVEGVHLWTDRTQLWFVQDQDTIKYHFIN